MSECIARNKTIKRFNQTHHRQSCPNHRRRHTADGRNPTVSAVLIPEVGPFPPVIRQFSSLGPQSSGGMIGFLPRPRCRVACVRG